MSSQSTESCLTASHHYSNCSAIPPAKCCRRGRLHFCLEPVCRETPGSIGELSQAISYSILDTGHMTTKFMQYMDADVQCAIWEEGMEGSPPCVRPRDRPTWLGAHSTCTRECGQQLHRSSLQILTEIAKCLESTILEL